MHIALLTDGIYPYVLGGMQKHSYYLVKYLSANNIHVDLYHFNQSDMNIYDLDCFTEQEKLFITAHVIEFPSLKKMPGHYIRESYKYSEAIYDLIKNKLDKFDFIYAKGFAGWKLIEEKKRGLKCPPVGVKFHGLNMFQPSYSFRNFLESKLLKKPALYNMLNADYVFSYGGKITDLTKKIGVDENKIIELPTGIDDIWLDKKHENVINEKRTFVFIGRYDKIKGIKELNKAIVDLNKNKLFVFHFIGPFPETKQLKYKNVFYHGMMNNPIEIQAITSKCDVLVCPSYSEGMPNVIMEAMAMGLAVIATDVGAVNVLVSDKNGWLLPYPSKKNIIDKLTSAVNINHEKLKEMKSNSEKIVNSTFRWPIIIKSLIKNITHISTSQKKL